MRCRSNGPQGPLGTVPSLLAQPISSANSQYCSAKTRRTESDAAKHTPLHNFMVGRISGTRPHSYVMLGLYAHAHFGQGLGRPSCRLLPYPSSCVVCLSLCLLLLAAAGPSCSHGLPNARRRHRQWNRVRASRARGSVCVCVVTVMCSGSRWHSLASPNPIEVDLSN